jgi:general secretion pathway protein D
MLVRTFHLNNLDAKKAVNLIRSIVQVRKLYVNEETNALVLRDTAEVAGVVEKILDANDVPEPEVVLDVEVVEITERNKYDLGLLLSPYNVSMAGFNSAGAMYSPTLTKGTTETVGVSQLVKAFSGRGFGGYVTVPNAQYSFGKTLTKGNILSNPKIRVKNREKAKFNVGTRVPITTTSSNGTLTNVSVQYIDVGVKLNAEPVIQVNNEISIRLSLEVSQAGVPTTVGGANSGTQVVDINTRNLDTVMTLKDGETSIIGGLIERKDNLSKDSVAGLGEIPVIGDLLSHNMPDKQRSELMLAITPRLIRGVTVPSAKLASFGSGKEDDPTLSRPYASFDLEPEYEGEQKKKQQPDVKGAVTTVPGPVSPNTAAPAATDTNPPKVARSVDRKAAAAGKATLGFVSEPAAPAGEPVLLTITLADAENLNLVTMDLIYDPELVEFVNAAEGAFFGKVGKGGTINVVPAGPGALKLKLAAGSGVPGVSGEGPLAVVTFRGKKVGPAGFSLDSIQLSGQGGKIQPAVALSSFVDIQ